jgi:hypothetical protein
VQSAGNLISNIKEDGLSGIGDTSIDDIRNVIQLGGLARIGYKNRQYSNALKNNTQIIGQTPSKTVVNVEGNRFELEGDLRQKGLNKGISAFGKNNLFSGKSQEAKKNFLNQIKDKLSSDDQKKLVDEILNKKSIGKVSFEFNPGEGGKVVLNNAPRSLDYRDVKSYNIAKKQLKRGYTQYGTIGRMLNKHNDVEIEPKITEESSIVKPKRTYKKSSIPKKDIGGLLSILNTNTTKPKLSFSNPIANKSWYKGLSNNIPTFEQKYSKINLSNTPSKKSAAELAEEAARSVQFERFEPVAYTKKPYKNLGDLFNTIQYGLNNMYNDRSANFQIRAAAEIPKLSTLSHTYLTTSTPYSSYASKQAAEMRGFGNRLGNNIADIDKANAYRLQANKQALDTELQGQYKDTELNNKIATQQADLNNKVDTYNSGVMDKNSELGAQARSSIYKIQANRELYKGNDAQNFLKYLTYSASERPYKEASWNYLQETLNPNITRAYEYAAKLQDEGLQAYKEAYDKYYNSLDKNSPEYLTRPKFEDSPMYKAWQNKVSAHNSFINSLNSNLYTLQKGALAASPYGMAALAQTSSYSKGGSLTLNDRIMLENVKTVNRKSLKQEELFYRQLLNNNKLVQAALIKVFK